MVPKPPRRFARALLKGCRASSRNKISKPANLSEVDVIEDSKTSQRGYAFPEDLPLGIPVENMYVQDNIYLLERTTTMGTLVTSQE